jgi:hypothetical protein
MDSCWVLGGSNGFLRTLVFKSRLFYGTFAARVILRPSIFTLASGAGLGPYILSFQGGYDVSWLSRKIRGRDLTVCIKSDILITYDCYRYQVWLSGNVSRNQALVEK